MEEEVPDFSRFLSESCEPPPDAKESISNEESLADAVEALLLWRNPETGELQDSQSEQPATKKDQKRRLVFQGGFTRAYLVRKQLGSPAEKEDESASRGLNLFSSTKKFWKKKIAKVVESDTDKDAEHLEEWETVRDAVANGKERMTQCFIFDDALVLARTLERTKDSHAGNLIGIATIPMEAISIRELGTGYFVFEDLDDEDVEEEEGEEEENETSEDSHAKGMDSAKSMLEILDRSTGSRYLVDTGGEEHRKMWMATLVKACIDARRKKNPGIVAERGWMHRIHRGTLWSAALEGNVYQLGRILRWMDSTSEDGNATSLDVDSVDESGSTPLHLAASRGHTLVVKQLLMKGAHSDALDNELMTPLHLAAMNLHDRACVALLDGQADVDARNLRDETPLLLCCKAATERLAIADDKEASKLETGAVRVIEALAFHHADLCAGSVEGIGALHLCAMQGQVSLVMALLRGGADPNATCVAAGNDLAVSPLAMLCAQDSLNLPLISKFLSWGANPNIRDKGLNTPLHFLLRNTNGDATDRKDVAQLLISNGARVDLVNEEGVSVEDLLNKNGIAFSEASRMWTSKEEPAAVSTLLRVSPMRIPFALGPGAPAWQEDTAVDACTSCQNAFSMMVRRHHCRRCGSLFCALCCNKSVTLNTSSNSESASAGRKVLAEPNKVKVCTGCFNRLSRELSIAATDVKGLQSPFEAERQALFGVLDAKPKAPLSESEKKEQRPSIVKSMVTSTQQALQQAQESLAERGEKLNRLSDKSAAMSDNAANFSSLARKLREQEEKKANWFGFF